MQASHSRIETFKSCPYKWKLHYIDNVQMLPSDDPASALLLGTAIHRAIETDSETAIKEYYMSYPIITDAHITEAIKIEHMAEKTKRILPEGKHEVLIETEEFKGFIDLLSNDGDIYDFKYSNNIEHYMESAQLSLYKYFAEKIGLKIRNLYFVFIPKVQIKQDKNESIQQFRDRVLDTLRPLEPIIRQVNYDSQKVQDWLETKQKMESTKEFPRIESGLCRFCEYNIICRKSLQESEDCYMQLPSTQRRAIEGSNHRKLWIYGMPFSGKTTMLDKAPNPLNLNTDSNCKFVTMPVIPIKDEKIVDGRLVKTKYGWETLKEAISELEKKQNDFKTIIIDLVDDTRELCRTYMYDKLNIKHESDSSFGKGWDMIKTEYLNTMKRFFNLDYENLVIVSHANTKDIKLKSGDTITQIEPNIQEAIATKLAGMVDIVARVNVEPDGSRTLNFKFDEYVFGGGRLKGITRTTIPLDWDELMKEYSNIALSASKTEPKGDKQ